MDFYSKLHKTIINPLWEKWEAQNYSKYYAQVETFCNSSREEMKRWQLESLMRVIDHAFHNVPYYRKLFDRESIDPKEIKSFKDFQRIPVLTKSNLRENVDMFLDMNSNKENLIKSGTGGTTDSPIPIYYDKVRNDIKMAETVYFRKWFGWYSESKVAYLWGAPMDIPNINSLKYKVKNKLFYRNLFLFANLLNDEVMDEYIDKINTFKPDIIQAYSNPAYLLASYINKTNRRIHSPRAVVVTAEPCYPSQKKLIEHAFGCNVYSFYGARESGYIATECPSYKKFHVNSHGLFLEILRNGKQVKPGEIGDVVITDLHNFVMPLIRYKIGDAASISSRECGCGCKLPLLDFIAGRETDVFVSPEGDLIPGVSLCDRVVTDCSGFAQLQFIQEKPDELNVKIVKGNEYSQADMISLDRILNDYFHGKMKINKIFVEDIPREKSGKTRFCISKVPIS